MSRIVAFVPDLMDRSRLSRIRGISFVADPSALAPAVAAVAAAGELTTTVVVDLSRPGVLDAVAGLAGGGTRIVGFISHVDREGTEAARKAGCDEVLARSAFFSRLPDVLG